jgi:hypothetical protein
MADGYAHELCIDAMHDGTLKGNLASAYLALKQENIDLWTELEMVRRIMRESGATSRDKVCEEFGAWNLYANEIPEEVHWRAAAAMADEIACLRHIIANMDHERRTNEREG